MGRRKPAGLKKRGRTWWIDKQIDGIRMVESCGTSDLAEAERLLTHRLEEIRKSKLYGIRPTRTLGQAAGKYLTDYGHKKSIAREGYAVKAVFEHVDPDIPIERVHNGTFDVYKSARASAGIKPGTINKDLAAIRRILNLAARVWRHDNGLAWLETSPLLEMVPDDDARKPYPLTWDEQTKLFKELPPYLERMTLFAVNTGLRDQEICKLRWEWEVVVQELETSVFVLPARRAGGKNKQDRSLVLNKIARNVVEEQRDKDPEWVFPGPNGGACHRMSSTAWKNARRRVGLPQVRIHDLKHTFGFRLRAAGVSFEDRQDLLGHKSNRITTHYSAPDIQRLLESANKVCERRESTILRPVTRTKLAQSVAQKDRGRVDCM